MNNFKILVAGAGIGGLALAAGLRRAGLHVAVFERDHAPADWLGGYRIHLNPDGTRALRACLPPELWPTFLDSTGQAPRGLTFATDQLRELIHIEFPAAAGGQHPISRLALRTLLLHAGPTVQFARQVVGYEPAASGRVRVRCADGSTAEGDVLVGADGTASRVRSQLLPAARVVDSGVVGISGQVPLGAWPRLFTSGLTTVIPPRGTGMFVAPFIHGPATDPARDLNRLPNHLFWAVVARRERFGTDLRGVHPHELRALAARMVAGWHPSLRRLVADADSDSLLALPLQSAQPVPAWPTSNVTLLGDALHTMTPLQGLGGNTALRDADALCQALIRVARGEQELRPALAEYEAAMREYGFAAVRRSLQVAEQGVSDSLVSRAGFKTMLRVASRVQPLRERLFPAGAELRD